MGMRGWLAFWAAVIGLLFLTSWAQESLRERTGSWVVTSAVVALIIGVLIARASHKSRVNAEVDALVTEHRNGDQGLFSEWFDNNAHKHADQYRVAEAARAVLRLYGGRHVINGLVNEGHQHVIYDDLADVFGDHRAGQIFFDMSSIANQPGFVAHLGAFGLGAFLGYKATARR